MAKPKAEWDPSWDDDWQTAKARLEEEIEDEHPHDPEEAVRLYREGYAAARRHPLHDWSDVEADLYQDYMSGAPEPGENIEEPQEGWEQARVWGHRGWEAGQVY